jgi:hypothetical protein
MELSPVLTLDIGGKRFRVLRATVMKYPNSLLAKVITGRDVDHMIIFDGAYFFDRNPSYFSVVLDFMRIGKLFLPANLLSEQLQAELRFWQVAEDHLNPNPLKEADIRIDQAKNNDYDEPTLVIPDNFEPTLLVQTLFEPTILIPSPKIEPTQLIEEPPSIQLDSTLAIDATPSKKPEEKIEQIVLTRSNKLKEGNFNPEEDDLLCSLVLEKPNKSKSNEIKTGRTLPWAKTSEVKVKKEENKIEEKKEKKEIKKNVPKAKNRKKKKNGSDSNDSFIEKDSDNDMPSETYTPKRKNVKSEVKKATKKPSFKKSDLVSEEELLKALQNSGS